MKKDRTELLGLTGVIFLSFASVLIRSEFFSSFILFVSFVFLIIEIKKNNRYKTNKKDLLLLTLPFFLALIGLIYTDNLAKALEFMVRLSPLFLVPVIYLNLSPKKLLKGFSFIFKYFPILTVLILLLYSIIGWFFSFKGYGNYLYYSNFSEIADVHTTYLGLIINLSTWFLLKQKPSYNKKLYYILLLGFFVFQVIVASKISILIFVSLMLFDVFLSFKNVYVKIVITTLILGVTLISVKQFLNNRFLNEKIGDDINLTIKQIAVNFYNNDAKTRVLLWQSNIKSLSGSKWIYGNGTNALDDLRKYYYKKNKLNKAFTENYNAHNQFIEVLFAYGLLGLILFVSHSLFIIKFAYKTQDPKLNMSLYAFILLYFMVESILQRSIGVVLYAFIVTYIYSQYRQFKYEAL